MPHLDRWAPMGSRLSRLAACASSRLCERHEVRGMSKVSGHARQTRERSAFGRVPLVLSVSLPQHEENVNLKKLGTSGRCARQADPACVKKSATRARPGLHYPLGLASLFVSIFLARFFQWGIYSCYRLRAHEHRSKETYINGQHNIETNQVTLYARPKTSTRAGTSPSATQTRNGHSRGEVHGRADAVKTDSAL